MSTVIKNKFVYFLNNAMYINITNLCTNNCIFCIKNLSDSVAGFNLKLEDERISSSDIIQEIKNNLSPDVKEIVFCGYGEPLIKLDTVKETAAFIKQNHPDIAVRINTNGHANLIHKRDVASELVGLIDSISVSLNADTPELYRTLTECKFDVDLAYESIKEFISSCVSHGIDTTATVVVGFKNHSINTEKCREIAEKLGSKFKIREWLSEGYK